MKFKKEKHVSIQCFRESWTVRVKTVPGNNLQRFYAFLFPNKFLLKN